MNTRFVLSAAGVSAAAIGGAATADITANITATSLLGGEYTTVSLGSVSGSITSIGYRYVWENNTGDSSWGSDMIFGASDGFNGVSIGGYNGYLSSIVGGSSSMWTFGGAINGAPTDGSYSGLNVLGSAVALSGDAQAIMANGWLASAGTTTSLEVTFYGLNAVPAPGALALLGLAGLAGGTRRRK
ncbi:MAG: PEP-CTERM sorting domain-containing protein [Phycisphaerales bacterium]|nr:PEP-CTERM sorting domain-containing protein [Phycisphaerales bacterium]